MEITEKAPIFYEGVQGERLLKIVHTGDPMTVRMQLMVPTTPACTWWNRPEEDPSSGKLESTHPSRTSVKYDQVFFGVESIMRVNAASLDIRDATTSTPGTLNYFTTDLIMANNNNNNAINCTLKWRPLLAKCECERLRSSTQVSALVRKSEYCPMICFVPCDGIVYVV